jgi:hypothetical protein
METEEALSVIRTLADGIDPVTGEIFPHDSPYQRAHTVRALMTVVEAVDSRRRRRAHLPAQTGKPWTEADDDRLRAAHAAGRELTELAAEHGRTTGGIRARLERFGLDPDRPGKALVLPPGIVPPGLLPKQPKPAVDNVASRPTPTPNVEPRTPNAPA